MSTRNRKITAAEIRTAFGDAPPILSIDHLSRLTNIPRKTLYEWVARGRLDGACRKRGKRYLIWRDRAIEILFNGSEWK